MGGTGADAAPCLVLALAAWPLFFFGLRPRDTGDMRTMLWQHEPCPHALMSSGSNRNTSCRVSGRIMRKCR
jgi:hypothetical protein